MRRRISQWDQVGRSPICRGSGLVVVALRRESPGQVGAGDREPLCLAQLADPVAAVLQLGGSSRWIPGRRGGGQPQPCTLSPVLLAVVVDDHLLGVESPALGRGLQFPDLSLVRRVAEPLEFVGPAQVGLRQVEPVDRRGLGQLENVDVGRGGQSRSAGRRARTTAARRRRSRCRCGPRRRGPDPSSCSSACSAATRSFTVSPPRPLRPRVMIRIARALASQPGSSIARPISTQLSTASSAPSASLAWCAQTPRTYSAAASS